MRTEVPPDYTDSDVRWNVEQWAKSGDKTAQLALELNPGEWYSFNSGNSAVRVYVDK